MVFLLRFSGIVTVLVAIWLTLDQIIHYPIVGWQWEQMLQFGHHESAALLLSIVVVLLFWYSFRLKRKKENSKKGEKEEVIDRKEVIERCRRIR